MKRRTFIAGTSAALTFGTAVRSVADISIGNGVLTTVSDGTLALPISLPEGVPQAELEALAARFELVAEEVTPRPLNVTLWRASEHTVLFDAGSGPAFVEGAGELLANLDAAGVSPDEITDVIFTHAHPDHIWGILDDFDEVTFPGARLWIGREEYDFWTDPATIDQLEETRKFFAVGAQRRLEAINDRLQFIADGETVVPGVTAMATFGHTPGHMSFTVADGDDNALVLGDAVTNTHLQLARPGWPSPNDQYPEAAARTRESLLAQVAEAGTRVIGYHLPHDGIGRIESEGEGYRFVPEVA